MKPHIRPRSKCHGSVLVVTLVTGVLLSMVLASYLMLVRHQNAMVARSQDWNSSLTAAEAGVEEAMAQLTHVPLTTNINRADNGWVLDNGSYRIPAPRTLLNGCYNVRFTDVGQPVIYATGTITNPTLNAVLSRTVEVRTTNDPVFAVGMAAIYTIKMNGNNILTDSYNSRDPNYSTDGMYDPAKALANGDVASVNGVFNVGNGDIHGNLLIGPTAVTQIGANGSVSGKIFHDFNAEFEDVKAPADLAQFFSPQSSMINQTVSTVVGTNTQDIIYAYAFANSGSYRVDSIKGPVYVGPNARVRLYVDGSVKINGSDNLYLALGGRLTIYMAGSDFSVGGVVNSGSPLNFSYYGLTNNTSIAFSGNGSFVGTIYAPQAALSLSGGGTSEDQVDFSGASVTKSVNMNGNLSFHYDQALKKGGPTIYKVASWREL